MALLGPKLPEYQALEKEDSHMVHRIRDDQLPSWHLEMVVATLELDRYTPEVGRYASLDIDR
jgi:hypothetical protein